MALGIASLWTAFPLRSPYCVATAVALRREGPASSRAALAPSLTRRSLARSLTRSLTISRAQYLRRHFNGDKPFACTKCHKKRFVVKEDLTMHMKACGNVYVCRCGIRLCSLGALKRHCKQFGHEPQSLQPTPEHGLESAAATSYAMPQQPGAWANNGAEASAFTAMLSEQQMAAGSMMSGMTQQQHAIGAMAQLAAQAHMLAAHSQMTNSVGAMAPVGAPMLQGFAPAPQSQEPMPHAGYAQLVSAPAQSVLPLKPEIGASDPHGHMVGYCNPPAATPALEAMPQPLD